MKKKFGGCTEMSNTFVLHLQVHEVDRKMLFMHIKNRTCAYAHY